VLAAVLAAGDQLQVLRIHAIPTKTLVVHFPAVGAVRARRRGYRAVVRLVHNLMYRADLVAVADVCVFSLGAVSALP
jgi:hypothetical protein